MENNPIPLSSFIHCGILHCIHHAQPVATPYLFDVGIAEATAQKLARYITQLGCRRATNDLAIAIEVSTDAYVVYAGYLYCMK